MTRISGIFTAATAAFLLTSCGGSSSPDPVEQIVVAEPGEAAAAGDAPAVSSDDLVAAGQQAFAVCSACHSVEKGEASSIGPNLYGVVGRKAGAKDDFKYSEAMSASGLTWDAATLDTYLTNPSAKVPGTTMLAGAVGEEDKRAAIIAYLTTLSD